MPAPLASGGAMGRSIRAKDWSATPLGPIESWPQSLRTAVGICTESRFPMAIWWGPHAVQLYNDGYTPVLGAKHPRALGQSGMECWAEIWDVVGPLYTQVMQRGESIWADDLLLIMERYGYVEETYFTFSYSPIRDETGGVGGLLISAPRPPTRVIGERRLRTAAGSGRPHQRGAHGARRVRARRLDPGAEPERRAVRALYLLDPAAARPRWQVWPGGRTSAPARRRRWTSAHADAGRSPRRSGRAKPAVFANPAGADDRGRGLAHRGR